MKKSLLVVLLVVVAIASYVGISDARSGYLGDLNALYGTSGSRLDTCDTCHVSGGKSRNPFGLGVEAGILAGKTATQSLIDIQSNDSDGDTYTNIVEINARYFPGDPNDHPVAGTPVISLSTGTIVFGQVTVYSSVTRTVAIQNTGNANLNVTSITRYSGTSTEYTWSPAAPFTIAPGGSTTLSVTYTPVDTTFDAGYLTIASNDPVRPTVNHGLSGSGAGAPAPIISHTTTTINFGQTEVYSSVTRTVAIWNIGNADLNVASISRCYGTSMEYTWSPDAPLTIVPGSSTTLSITYLPVDATTDSGCLAIASNDTARPTTYLNLRGSAAPAPIISLSTGTAGLNFGQVAVGSSAVRTVLVRNTGNADLNVTSIFRYPGTSTEYTWSPAAPFTVVSGGTTTLSVTYSPVDATTDSGYLWIQSNDPVRPTEYLVLSGSGVGIPAPIIGLSASSLSFGQVTMYSSVTRSVLVQNAGNADLNVSSIGRCSGTSTEYTWSPDAPLTIVPGGSTTLSVTYSPVDETIDNGCLELASNDPATSTVSLNLTGNGIATAAPIISLSTGTAGLNFGQATVLSSVTRSVLVQNIGNADLSVTSIGRCAGTSMEYTWSPDAPLTVAPGSFASLSVTYTPVDENTDNGCLSIMSNDSVNPTVDLALTGSGIAPLPQPIDIDISSLTVTGRVSLARVKPIVPSLTVSNQGALSSGTGSVTANLVGVENSATIYNQTISLDNIAVGATATFAFPSYTPNVIGNIAWTVIVNDTDADSDTATGLTKIVK